jgi:hypothetical protein
MSAHLFLLVFHRAEARTEVEDLGTDAAEAIRVLKERERASNGADVILLGSDSLDTLKRTHSSYFGTSEEVERLLGRAPA